MPLLDLGPTQVGVDSFKKWLQSRSLPVYEKGQEKSFWDEIGRPEMKVDPSSYVDPGLAQPMPVAMTRNQLIKNIDDLLSWGTSRVGKSGFPLHMETYQSLRDLKSMVGDKVLNPDIYEDMIRLYPRNYRDFYTYGEYNSLPQTNFQFAKTSDLSKWYNQGGLIPYGDLQGVPFEISFRPVPSVSERGSIGATGLKELLHEFSHAGHFSGSSDPLIRESYDTLKSLGRPGKALNTHKTMITKDVMYDLLRARAERFRGRPLTQAESDLVIQAHEVNPNEYLASDAAKKVYDLFKGGRP